MTQPSIIRSFWVDTANTGGSMTIGGSLDGRLEFVRVDPDGVQMTADGKVYNLDKSILPVIGRYFYAAAILQGQDPNEGWDKVQHARA